MNIITTKKRMKLVSESSFDELADELIGSKKHNLSHGDNSEVIKVPESDLAYYQKIGRKLNDQWLI